MGVVSNSQKNAASNIWHLPNDDFWVVQIAPFETNIAENLAESGLTKEFRDKARFTII